MAARKKIYTLAELRKLCKEQEYKHARLLDQGGEVIVSWNPTLNKKITVEKKLAEIERRMKALDPGIYVLEFRARFSGREPAYSYYVGNKNYSSDDLSENDSVSPVVSKKQVADDKPTKGEKLLSVESAINYVQENATLKAENIVLKREIESLKKEVADLEAELESDDGKAMSDPAETMTKAFKGFGDIALPVFNRLMDQRDRKQAYEETKFLHENGYDTGIKRKQRNKSRASAQDADEQEEIDFNENIPTPDEPAWDDYLAWLNDLEDDDFSDHLEKVKGVSDEIHEKLCEVFNVTFD